jgi:hypothetical protein
MIALKPICIMLLVITHNMLVNEFVIIELKLFID